MRKGTEGASHSTAQAKLKETLMFSAAIAAIHGEFERRTGTLARHPLEKETTTRLHPPVNDAMLDPWMLHAN